MHERQHRPHSCFARRSESQADGHHADGYCLGYGPQPSPSEPRTRRPYIHKVKDFSRCMRLCNSPLHWKTQGLGGSEPRADRRADRRLGWNGGAFNRLVLRHTKSRNAQYALDVDLNQAPERVHMIPRLLPDELLNGNFGRVGWVNGTDQVGPIFKRALEDRGIDHHGLHPVEMVAHTSGLDLETLICRHTYWALLNCGGYRSLSQQISMGMRKRSAPLFRRSRVGVWLCPECVKEDLGFWRFSYWRRRHQIPGQYKCDKHMTPLAVVYAAKALSRPPHHWLNQLVAPEWDMAPDHTNQHIERFIETFDLISQQVGYLDRRELCKSLRRMSGGSERFSERTVCDLPLTELARARLPAWWLNQTLNTPLDTRDEKPIDCFRLSAGARVNNIGSVALIIATSLLAETAEAAARVLRDHLTRDAIGDHVRNKFCRNPSAQQSQ
jgi:TniQ